MEQMLNRFDASLFATETREILAKNKDLVFLARTVLNKALGLFCCLEVSGVTVVNPE